MAFENNLITITDIQEFKPLSKNTDTDKKVNPFILEAQEFSIRPFLSDEFYEELITQIKSGTPSAEYDDLFNGSKWVSGSKTYTNPGLKVVLVYYAYSRYLNRANTNSTAFGMVEKNNPDSTPITDKRLGSLISQAESGAQAYENRVKEFLDCNSKDYPLYTCSKPSRSTGGLRISAANGSDYKKHYDRKTKRYI